MRPNAFGNKLKVLKSGKTHSICDLQYMLKGPTVIGFSCCGVPAILHLYTLLLYCICIVMHVIRQCNFTSQSSK